MQNYKLLPALLLLLAGNAGAVIQNGNFEQWTGNQPVGWTVVDSGISVSPDTGISMSGTAAAITVTTTDQAATDFRQTISVQAGQQYDFSVAVYHTEGHVKSRLYVDGYQGYASENLTGQWQILSYRYTATSTANIEVGLRFYDVTGFDGAERVYVDNFLPTETTAPDTGCSGQELSFSLTTDNYASETSWQLTDSANQSVYSGAGYNNNSNNTTLWCLADGDYTFVISDSYGDGICCSFGNGQYSLTLQSQTLFSGGEFSREQRHSFHIGAIADDTDLGSYYAAATGLTGYTLKTALHNIIKTHTAQGYGALWSFYAVNELDNYYEQDGSLLDIYSENPASTDSYVYAAVNDQCGTYNSEADCYNREHSFPRSWFGGAIEPMNSDVHHIFATDGYVNSKRSSYPYGKVGNASYVSTNGSKLGTAASGFGYNGIVFEPIDEFKGDLARAYFYMATRYQDQIAQWQTNSVEADAVLNGTSTQVFETGFLQLLKQWHQQDPVSQKEIDRNNAAYVHQGNRNPFVDHPQFVSAIWGN